MDDETLPELSLGLGLGLACWKGCSGLASGCGLIIGIGTSRTTAVPEHEKNSMKKTKPSHGYARCLSLPWKNMAAVTYDL
jgi:hypothetical protein